MKVITLCFLATVWILAASTPCSAETIYANDPDYGDYFTNSGPMNQGMPIGSTGWYYNNTRNGGTVGINSSQAHSGDGSIHFQTINSNSKADIELLGNATSVAGNYTATAPLGSLSNLTSLSYDWYRDSSSTTNGHHHPILRLLIDLDGNTATSSDRRSLTFERAYNIPLSDAPVDTWVTENIFSYNSGAGANLWANGSATMNPYQITLAEWQAGIDNLDGNLNSASAVILGISIGVGSAWMNSSSMWVDNVQVSFSGVTDSYNFEVAAQVVPEPGTASQVLIGFLQCLRRRRPAKG